MTSHQRNLPEGTEEKVRALRAQGLSFREVAHRLGISASSAFYAMSGRGTPKSRMVVPANDNTPATPMEDRAVWLVPNNGGCSSLSGMVPVTLRRIRALEKDAA